MNKDIYEEFVMELENEKVGLSCKNLITLRVFSETSLKKAFNSSVTPLSGKKELSHSP